MYCRRVGPNKWAVYSGRARVATVKNGKIYPKGGITKAVAKTILATAKLCANLR